MRAGTVGSPRRSGDRIESAITPGNQGGELSTGRQRRSPSSLAFSSSSSTERTGVDVESARSSDLAIAPSSARSKDAAAARAELSEGSMRGRNGPAGAAGAGAAGRGLGATPAECSMLLTASRKIVCCVQARLAVSASRRSITSWSRYSATCRFRRFPMDAILPVDICRARASESSPASRHMRTRRGNLAARWLHASGLRS